MEAYASTQSKFVLSELALRSIIEIERLNAGMEFDNSVLEALSSALLQASRLEGQAAQLAFIEPEYFVSLERLYRIASSADDGDVEKIRGYTKKISEQLNSPIEAGSDVAAALLSVCETLHSELVQDLTIDDSARTHEWPNFDTGAQVSLCAA